MRTSLVRRLFFVLGAGPRRVRAAKLRRRGKLFEALECLYGHEGARHLVQCVLDDPTLRLNDERAALLFRARLYQQYARAGSARGFLVVRAAVWRVFTALGV